jgi:hypothetical protein
MLKWIPFVVPLMLCFFDAAAQNDLNSRMALKLLTRLKSCKADTQKIGILISLYETELNRYPDYKRQSLLDSAYNFLIEAKKLNIRNHNYAPAQTIEIAEEERYFVLGDSVKGQASFLKLAAKYHKARDYYYEAEVLQELSEWFNKDDERYSSDQLQWLSKAKSAAALAGDKTLEGKIWYATSRIHFFKKELNLAASEANHALQLYQSAHAKVTQNIYYLIGDIQYASGNVPGAIDATLKAYDCMKETKDSTFYGQVVTKLMLLYAEHGMTKPALFWALNLLHHDDAIGDHGDGHFIVITSTVRIYLKLYGVKASLLFLDSILKRTPPKTLRQTQYVSHYAGRLCQSVSDL